MEQKTQVELEAAACRRLLKHLDEHRSDEPGWLLPELPEQMLSCRSGGARHRNGLRDSAPASLWHVLRGVEGKVSESSARGMILAELRRSEYI
jgi:hypothetical protein